MTERLYHRTALGIALLAILARFWVAWQTHSTGEDALITLRYAENIAAGHGFVYNPGEHVLGSTTPLYTLLLALFVGLRADALLLGKACNILADGLTCYLLARLLARKEIDQPIAGLFAALLYAFTSTPISVSIGGMETGLVTCVGVWMLYAFCAQNSRALYALGAVLFLLRIDGLLLFGLLAVASAWRARKIPWKDLALALLIALPWLLFATLYFGSPIPTSLVAKLLVYGSGAETSRAMIREAFATQFLLGGFQRLVTLLFLLGLGRVVWTGPRSPLAAPLLWLLLYYGTMFTSPVPAFAWYFLPPWPLFLGMAALGGGEVAARVARLLPEGPRRSLGRVWPVALLAYGIFGILHLKAVRNQIATDQFVEDTLRRPMGEWLGQNSHPNERIFLEPIGYVGYYSRRPILDMIGLVSPEVFVSYHNPHYLPDMLARFRPEWLCLRPSEAERMTAQGRALPDAEYAYVREFHVPGRAPDFLIFHRKK